MTRFDDAFAPIAVAARSGLDESLHHGAGVVLDADGAIEAEVGDASTIVYARSSLKPMQADAMLHLGVELSAAQLALACASHSGEVTHLDTARSTLHAAGLTEGDLQNTPSRPYDAAARGAARAAGTEPSSLQQNCSGKHAAMLATCRANQWPTDSYLDATHPLQQAITTHIARLTGQQVTHVGVDGCGAPTHAISLHGLATAFGFLARHSAVAAAMSQHPELVGGTGRDVTMWMRAVPGLIAKEGAAGVMAAALGDGRACAFKIADGSDVARRAVTMEAMRLLGVDADVLERIAADVAVPVLGHGRQVGELVGLTWPRR